MNILFYIANTLVLPPAMFFSVNYYRYRGNEIDYKKLPITTLIIVITALVTGLQFVFLDIIPVLDRNKEALFAGEIWRLITPLFIQPMGILQCVFNGVFLLVFMPVAEHFYGKKLIFIYFVAGIAGQGANFYWNKVGGGSSTAIYGVIGSLFMYILLNRDNFPKPYTYLAIAPFIGSIVLCFYQDGHAPGLLTGAVVALVLIGRKSRYSA